MNMIKELLNLSFLYFVLLGSLLSQGRMNEQSARQQMMFGDTTRTGRPFAKDPHVVRFKEKYLMYYSIPPFSNKSNPIKGWGIGIAESYDLTDWRRIGEITPLHDYESKGVCAPCALVIRDEIHLFYQTYGNGCKDAICHATSANGTDIIRDPSNPIFHPSGRWNCGRAIDAEITRGNDKYFLYYATRDTAAKIQMLGVATAPLNTRFGREDWTPLTDYPILKPELPWEGRCIEAPSVMSIGGILFMFYAGAFNNEPQQIGVARSGDGIEWTRLSDEPFLRNGKMGQWNSSESGHPHVFEDSDGKTYLFYQGNNDNGKTWFISKTRIMWNGNGPYLPAE